MVIVSWSSIVCCTVCTWPLMVFTLLSTSSSVDSISVMRS